MFCEQLLNIRTQIVLVDVCIVCVSLWPTEKATGCRYVPSNVIWISITIANLTCSTGIIAIVYFINRFRMFIDDGDDVAGCACVCVCAVNQRVSCIHLT